MGRAAIMRDVRWGRDTIRPGWGSDESGVATCRPILRRSARSKVEQLGHKYRVARDLAKVEGGEVQYVFPRQVGDCSGQT